jgi:hypothetical protein
MFQVRCVHVFLFMVLAHEYLHSFGIVDEFRVRQMAYDLCSSLLGNEHPASIMAKEDPSALFPELSLLRQNKFDEHFEVVKNFDKTISHISNNYVCGEYE